MNIKKLKVVCSGRDVLTDANFNIVKIGDYKVSEEGFLAALKDGIFDKYGKQSPEFKCISFNINNSYELEGKHHTVCVFACEEWEVDEPEVLTLIAGKVTFSKILELSNKE